ncbi:VanW family protein [Myxococcaceae bacterium GXIMD 01537]
MSTRSVPHRLVDESRPELLVRRGKQLAHQARRLALWAATPGRWPRPQLAPAVGLDVQVALRTVDLARADEDTDPRLEAGKQHNVKLAAPAFDGLWVTPERPLSFWRTLGRLTERAGFRHGLSLRGGCLTPSVGGGICLLGNALFELAARQGWHILERHGHTMEAVPPEPGTLWGMDATVAWPYVDLVVAPREGPVRLGAHVEAGRLRLSLHAAAPPRTRSLLWSEDDRTEETPDGPMRLNRIMRRVTDVATGAVLEEQVIAENRRRLLRSEERRRNCFTCGEDQCHARVELPRAETGT